MNKDQLIEDIKIEMENLERLKGEMKVLLEKIGVQPGFLG